MITATAHTPKSLISVSSHVHKENNPADLLILTFRICQLGRPYKSQLLHSSASSHCLNSIVQVQGTREVASAGQAFSKDDQTIRDGFALWSFPMGRSSQTLDRALHWRVAPIKHGQYYASNGCQTTGWLMARTHTGHVSQPYSGKEAHGGIIYSPFR